MHKIVKLENSTTVVVFRTEGEEYFAMKKSDIFKRNKL